MNDGSGSFDHKEHARKPRKDGSTWIPVIPDSEPYLARFMNTYPGAQFLTSLWIYRDETGAVVFYRMRLDFPGEPKKIITLSLWRSSKDEVELLAKGLPPTVLNPLFGLDRIKALPNATVIVCEGEKAALAAEQVFSEPHYVCVTATGGTGSVFRTDFAPLNHRQVVIAPDADEVGDKYAHDVQSAIRTRRLKVVDIRKLAAIDPANPDGPKRAVVPSFDIADAVEKDFLKARHGPRMPEPWTDFGALREAVARCVERPEKQILTVEAGQLSVLADEAERILKDAGVEWYQRTGAIVRPIIEKVDATRGRKADVASFERLNPTYVRDLIGRVIEWQKLSKGKLVPADPPPDVALMMLARVGEWSFDRVTGIVTTPTMRPDGSLLTKPGFDADTGLLLVSPPLMDDIPERPTKDDALEALALLAELLSEFLFVDQASHSVALSALMTPVVRGAFTVCPMHAVRSPVAGSGKSYLLDVVAAISIGQPMPVIAIGRSEEETEKRLGARLLTGQSMVALDNVNGELGGDFLCQACERPSVYHRILGKSELKRIETRGTTLFANGNNLTVVGDLCRRVITSSLDARMERPELRKFAHDPVATVLASRGAYVAAVLTICRAYLAAGQPDKAPHLGSFEEWSDLVRSALMWLGEADPVSTMEISRSEDPTTDELAAVLKAWGDVIGIGSDYQLTLKNVLVIINEVQRREDGVMIPRWPDFQEAIHAVGERRGQMDPRTLGLWARDYKGVVVGTRRLVCKSDRAHGSKWWVEDTDVSGGRKAGMRIQESISQAEKLLAANVSTRAWG